MTTSDETFKNDLVKLNLDGDDILQKTFLPIIIRDFFVRAAQDPTVKNQLKHVREAARLCISRYLEILKKEDLENWPTLTDFCEANLDSNPPSSPLSDTNHTIHSVITDVNAGNISSQPNASVTLLETSRFILGTLNNMFKDNQRLISKINALEQNGIERHTWISCLNMVMHNFFTEPIQYFIICLNGLSMGDTYEDTPAKHVIEFNRRFDNLRQKDKNYYTQTIKDGNLTIVDEFGIPLEDDKEKSIQLWVSLFKLKKNKEFKDKISQMWHETISFRRNTTDLLTIKQSEFSFFSEKLLTLNTKSMNNTNSQNNLIKKEKTPDKEQNAQVQNKLKKEIKNFKCTICEMNNHTTENCFKNSTSKNFKFCSHCNKTGHLTNDCKRKNMAMNVDEKWSSPSKISKWGNNSKSIQNRITDNTKLLPSPEPMNE
jgi:hypothetical protein